MGKLINVPPIASRLAIMAILLSSCASWRADWAERRAAARALAEVQAFIAKLPRCSEKRLASAATSVPSNGAFATVVTVRGRIRIGLEQDRFAYCLGNELTGCAPYTGPWILMPAAGGPELFELWGFNEAGWVSREGAVMTLTDRWLAEVVVTGKLGQTLAPEERARAGRRIIDLGMMCKTS